MKAARFFSICEIVCFVGLALSYIGYASQSLEALSRYFVLGMFLFSLLILLLSVCNLIAAARVKKRLNDPAIRSTIWKLVVSMKLIAIPMFLVNFLYGIIYGVFSVIFVFTAPIVLMEISGCLVCHDGLVRLLHCAHPARAQAGQNQHRNRSPAGHFPVYLRC